MNDEIISEVWHNRDKLAAKYNNDIEAIAKAIQARETHPLNIMVSPDESTETFEQGVKKAVESLWGSVKDDNI